MKYIPLFLLILLVPGCYQGGLRGPDQPENTIVRRVSDYILVGTDQGVGAVNDEIAVYRMTDSGVVQVGKMKIVRFQNGQTAARVTEEKEGYQIAVGDIVPVTPVDGIEPGSPESAVVVKPKTRSYLTIISSVMASIIILLLLINAGRDAV